ncbi:PREDICTED: uncharacterized protein LOC105563031, partial [Vollenhovia emeryi]|uniref:uncharacterized protein LOC105563031 n=1 Tax=Vollenhovia emeryi TaxID=411798 RepID=UPI0005F53413
MDKRLMDSHVEDNEFTCKHCSNTIATLDDVPVHGCFLGKEVYMHNNILYTEVASKSSLHIVNDILQSEESVSQDDQDTIQDEDKENSKKKQDAVWTRNKTLALLSLYEANVNMLDNPRKKTKIWATISTGLQDFNIK